MKVEIIPPILGLILVILLLLMSSVPNRLRYGKFSNLTISLSDKSMVSNWSCEKSITNEVEIQVDSSTQDEPNQNNEIE